MTSNPHLRQVIEIEVRRGTGTADDPVRLVSQYFSADDEGKLLAEFDPRADVEAIRRERAACAEIASRWGDGGKGEYSDGLYDAGQNIASAIIERGLSHREMEERHP